MDASQQQVTARSEAFGYVCHACSRCCRHKVIQVNPYEIARLARRTGRTVAQFRAECTQNGAGNILLRDEHDSCIFLGAEGCTVHSDRPLVCRLYPLGRRVAPDRTEMWVHVAPHPQSAGEYSKDGTIAEFIEAQGALSYMRAADDYADWVRSASALRETDIEASSDISPDELLDMDVAIAMFCAATGETEPAGIEERRILHMKILYRHLEQCTGGEHDKEQA